MFRNQMRTQVGSLLNGTKKLAAVKAAVDEAQARREAYWRKVSARVGRLIAVYRR
jgi:hypothetical protein